MAVSELDAELQKAAGRVVSHMNDDHATSVLAYAHAFGGDVCASAVSATMTGLTRDGFLLDVQLATGEVLRDVLIKYTKQIESAGQLHKVAVDMHFAAYSKLGFGYKLAHGYYLVAGKMVAFGLYGAAKKRPCATVAVVGGITAAVVAYKRR